MNETIFKADRIVWTLVRGMERTERDFGVEKLSEFRAGDIVEVNGFARKNALIKVKKVAPLGEMMDYAFVQAMQDRVNGNRPEPK